VVSLGIEVNNVRLLIGALCGAVPRDCAIVIKTDPLGSLVQSIADWDVEVGDLPIVESVAFRRSVVGVLIVEDMLLEPLELLFICLGDDGGVGFVIGDGLG
jgi:hypothetical protein